MTQCQFDGNLFCLSIFSQCLPFSLLKSLCHHSCCLPSQFFKALILLVGSRNSASVSAISQGFYLSSHWPTANIAQPEGVVIKRLSMCLGLPTLCVEFCVYLYTEIMRPRKQQQPQQQSFIRNFSRTFVTVPSPTEPGFVWSSALTTSTMCLCTNCYHSVMITTQGFVFIVTSVTYGWHKERQRDRIIRVLQNLRRRQLWCGVDIEFVCLVSSPVTEFITFFDRLAVMLSHVELLEI